MDRNPDQAQHDRLWALLCEMAQRFRADTSPRSDAFVLLSVILAFYQTQGKTPESLLTDDMTDLIHHQLKRTYHPSPHVWFCERCGRTWETDAPPLECPDDEGEIIEDVSGTEHGPQS